MTPRERMEKWLDDAFRLGAVFANTEDPGKADSLFANFFALKAEALAAVPDDRMFPMQEGPAIPWKLAEQIYAGYVALNGSGSQTLERIAERGGFGWGEVAFMWGKNRSRDAMLAASPKPPGGGEEIK